MKRRRLMKFGSLVAALGILVGVFLANRSSRSTAVDRDPSPTRPLVRAGAPVLESNSFGEQENDAVFAPPWSKPFGDPPFAITVASMDAAQRKLTFKMAIPKTYAPDTVQVAPDGHAVGFAFNLPAYGGWVQLVEHATQATPDAYVSAFLGANYTKTSVDGGALPAAQGTLNGAANVNWADGGVAFDLTGETITAAQAANLIGQLFY